MSEPITKITLTKQEMDDLGWTNTVKRCPSCHEPVEPGWTFCGCGADLPVDEQIERRDA